MKKKLIALSLLMSIVGVSKAETASVMQVLQKTPQWGLVQTGTACIENYRFLPSGEVLISSNQERVSGTYSFISKENSFELPAVVIGFQTDNQQPDCTGSRENQAGSSTTNFLKKESDQKIYFCIDSLGKNCPVYLRPEH
ncbi:MAG: hypothetical protein RR575_11320 [Acinetobacter sp.]